MLAASIIEGGYATEFIASDNVGCYRDGHLSVCPCHVLFIDSQVVAPPPTGSAFISFSDCHSLRRRGRVATVSNGS